MKVYMVVLEQHFVSFCMCVFFLVAVILFALQPRDKVILEFWNEILMQFVMV